MRRIIVLFGALLPLALAGQAAAETSAPAAGRLTIVRTAVDDLKAVYATVESVHQVSRPVTAVLKRLDAVRGRLVPDGIEVTVTRDYGRSADDKVNELLFHLALATVTIVGLVGLAIGRREGLVVLVVIPTTILLTLFS